MRFTDVDRNAVLVQNRPTGQRRNPAARDQDPDQVQWAGRGDEDHLALVALAPDGAQCLDRLRERELLRVESVHKTAAPDLPARLEPPIDAQQGSPRGGTPLPCSTR